MALSSSSLPLINASAEETAHLNPEVDVNNSLTPVTSEVPAVVSTITILPQDSSPEAAETDMKKSRVGRPRTKPQKEKREWHQHLGGVRQCRYIHRGTAVIIVRREIFFYEELDLPFLSVHIAHLLY